MASGYCIGWQSSRLTSWVFVKLTYSLLIIGFDEQIEVPELGFNMDILSP